MKIVMLLLTFNLFAQTYYVDGYQRKDGTYVQGHLKTKSDRTIYNNMGYSGNQNRVKSFEVKKYKEDSYKPYKPKAYNYKKGF